MGEQGREGVDVVYALATGVGTVEEIRSAKVLDKNKNGLDIWTERGLDFMSGFSLRESAPPLVINVSLGSHGTG